MIEIMNKGKCSGCGACRNVCPVNCIRMELDQEGFLYPVVDKEKCTKCGLCNKVCHLENRFSRNDNEECLFFCAYNNEIEITRDSSSGGIFWLLVEDTIIEKSGVVYGVVLKNNFYVTHERAETLEKCKDFRKSKYLESDTGLVYQNVKRDLDNKKFVLFSGTPCQIAGLYSFLQKDYDTLLTCEVVCHGVPSKVVFDKYIKELNEENNDLAVSINWRDKRIGWYPNMVSIQFGSANEIVSSSAQNPYQKGFLKNLYLRPSCYECPYARLPRISDISLADFWGYEGLLKELNQNNGLSIVILSSEKGKTAFRRIKDKCKTEVVEKDYVMLKSRHSHSKPIYNKYREAFFKELNKTSFKKLAKKYIFLSIFKRVLGRVKMIIER